VATIVKLPANSDSQTVLSFTGLDNPVGIAVDNVGNVYVTDAHNNRVLWAHTPRSTPTPPWQASSHTEWLGPFSGLQAPRGVVMNAGQDFYVVDSGNNRVLHWKTGMTAPEVLAFTGLSQPDGIAVDGNSNVWLTDTGNNRVLQLPSNSTTTQTALSFTGLNNPHGVAIGPDGVYVADGGNNRVLKFKTDPTSKVTTLSVVPLTGLEDPRGVAVDGQGNLYVVDSGNNRVLKLKPA
jgi:DNA-binding beta-propeller fold protein YncE